MSWQDTWRDQAWSWARRLDAIATGWLQLSQQGRMDSATVAEKRKLVLKVRGWIYEVIDRFLGGVDKLPNRVGLGALPHLIVGGVVVVTVASIGAWVANEEERAVIEDIASRLALRELALDPRHAAAGPRRRASHRPLPARVAAVPRGEQGPDLKGKNPAARLGR